MMNDTFNFTRLLRLFKKYSLEHAKTNLLSVSVCGGLLFLLLAYYCYDAKGHLGQPAQAAAFLVFMLLAGSIYTSLTFIKLGDKRKSIPVLTLPASHLEKFLVAWLYSYIFFQLVFLAVFYLITTIVIHLGVDAGSSDSYLINVLSTDNKAFMAFPIYALLHAFTICGAIFFEKLHFIKTSFLFFILIMFLTLVNNQIIGRLINSSMESVPFQGMGFEIEHRYWRIFPEDGIKNFGWYVLGLCIMLLWSSAFFRLKEKEV